MADVNEDDFSQTCLKICKIFNISQLNNFQMQSLDIIVNQRKDIYINLPTGFGKSLIYQAIPFFKNASIESPIVVVVSPLVNLMKDQVKYLNSIGIKATSLSLAETELERRNIENGLFSIVYGSPEMWLSDRFRKMLLNSVYTKRVCAVAVDEAHIISHWGTSNSAKKAAFRESFSHLHELRSLVPSDTPFVALTATATESTKQTIFKTLRLNDDCSVISQSPNKPNIAYSVVYMDKEHEPEHYFQWLINSISEEGVKTPRVIIYCQTIKQCHLLYFIFKRNLGDRMFKNCENRPRNTMVEMLHSCTPAENKENILASFQDKDGIIRVLIATIAFGMGVDCKGVQTVIHFGPSKNIEAYIQECGRAGRNGQQSHVWLLYNSVMLIHVDLEMKMFLKTKSCRRHYILRKFEFTVSHPGPAHTCCDNCAQTCQCGSNDCKTFTVYPLLVQNESQNKIVTPRQVRTVTDEQRTNVKEELILYRKELIRKLLAKSPGGNLVSFLNPRFLLGFSVIQIEQVLSNVEKLFTIDDITSVVEIWDMKHACMVQFILNKVFNDIPCMARENDESSDEEEEMNDEWADAIPDMELMELLSESLNVLELDDSLFQATASSLDVTPEQLSVFDEH